MMILMPQFLFTLLVQLDSNYFSHDLSRANQPKNMKKKHNFGPSTCLIYILGPLKLTGLHI